MSSIKNAFLLSLAGAITLVIGIVFLELIFGSWFNTDPWAATERLNLIRDKMIVHDVRKLQFGQATTTYSRDKFGLRENCKSTKNMKIVAIGGSTTDQRFISDGQTWADVLQRRIREKTHDPDICVANAGMDGQSTIGNLYALEKWFPLIPDFKPEYYVLYLGINDSAFIGTGNRGFDPDDTEPSLGRKINQYIKSHSALYRLYSLVRNQLAVRQAFYAGHDYHAKLESEYGATQLSPDTDSMIQKNSKAFEGRLNRILALIKARGGTPICISQPQATAWRFGDRYKGRDKVFIAEGKQYNGLDFRASLLSLNAVMRRQCVNAGGLYIDLAAHEFLLTDFYDYVHMTPEGSEKAGSLMFDGMARLFDSR